MSEVLPNTTDDDTLEHVVLHNVSCDTVSLSGYILEDARSKRYILDDNLLTPGTTLRLPRTTTKLELNNNHETLSLLDASGNTIDTFGWSTSTKGESIIRDSSFQTCIPETSGDTPGTTEAGESSELHDSEEHDDLTENESGSEDTDINDGTGTGTSESDESHTGNTASGSIDTTSGSVNTGALDNSGNSLSEDFLCHNTPPSEIALTYADTDNNHRIDTLEILYDQELTGSISLDQIFLYSNTGGLFPSRINTETGYFLSGKLSGSSLILTLREGDIEKTNLKVTNSTTSELRLKSSGNFGLTNYCGGAVKPLYLTTSFSGYSHVSFSGKSLSAETLSGGTYSGMTAPNADRALCSGSQSPIALSLSYRDQDKNGKIDTLEIVYDQELTGSVSLDDMYLYSNTGGLFTDRVNTQTGYFLAGNLSGSSLILTLREGDIEKTNLKVTNSTTSDLRLKTTGNYGLTNYCGGAVTSLYLTTSFDSYKNIVGESMETPSSGIINQLSEHFPLPPVRFDLQSPTNVTLSGDTFLCTTGTCRLNLTLMSSFTEYTASQYSCRVTVNSGASITNCNPATLYLSGDGIIHLEIFAKNNSGSVSEVWYYFSQGNLNTGTSPSGERKENRSPVARIDFDGKLKEYYSFENGILQCVTNTCSINLTGEHSFDPDGDKLQYLWIWGENNVSTTRDPGVRKYARGDHIIRLRVIDPYGLWDEVKLMISVIGPEEKQKTVKHTKDTSAKDSAKQKNQKKSSKPTIKPLEQRKHLSFPEFLLQTKNKSVTESENTIHCITKTESCKLNFTLTGGTKGVSYKYEWGIFGERITKKNPPSIAFPLGITLVTMRIWAKDGSMVEYVRTVEVVAQQKQLKKTSSKSAPSSWKKVGFPLLKLETRKNVSESAGIIVCETTQDFCKLNFAFTGGIKGRGVKYRWDFPGSLVTTRNPKSVSFPLGISHVSASVCASDGVCKTYSREIDVRKKENVLGAQSGSILTDLKTAEGLDTANDTKEHDIIMASSILGSFIVGFGSFRVWKRKRKRVLSR